MDKLIPCHQLSKVLRSEKETVIRSNSEGDKRAGVLSSITSKSCEQNTVAALNDIDNVRHGINVERMYSESLGKPCKENTVI